MAERASKPPARSDQQSHHQVREILICLGEKCENFMFENPEELLNHYRKEHTRKYDCSHPNCPRKGENGFTRKDNRNVHEKNVRHNRVPRVENSEDRSRSTSTTATAKVEGKKRKRKDKPEEAGEAENCKKPRGADHRPRNNCQTQRTTPFVLRSNDFTSKSTNSEYNGPIHGCISTDEYNPMGGYNLMVGYNSINEYTSFNTCPPLNVYPTY
ncbi:hypothetical protein RUND412_008404 [Rhizina undulata]